MKFLTAFKKGKDNLVKIVLDDGKQKWAKTTDAVVRDAQKNFEENEEVDVEYTEKNGRYTVQRIMKKGQTAKKSAPKSDTDTAEFTCEECGVKLKDDKYKKCYKCNQKARENKSSEKTGTGSGKPDYAHGAPYGSLLPEEAERRNKLATLSSVCQAVTTLTGHIDDPSTLSDVIIELYDKLYSKVIS